MAYQAEISRSNPTCVLFLVDQSGSMADPFGSSVGRSKADELATILNRLLASLVIPHRHRVRREVIAMPPPVP